MNIKTIKQRIKAQSATLTMKELALRENLADQYQTKELESIRHELHLTEGHLEFITKTSSEVNDLCFKTKLDELEKRIKNIRTDLL